MTVSAELPKYECHKQVHALKITGIDLNLEGDPILEVEEPYAPIVITEEWLRRHNPQAGGYYVVYKDGYTSYSPAEAFEDGYTRI